MVNLAQLNIRREAELPELPSVLTELRPEFHEMRACVVGDGAFLTVSCDDPSDAQRRLIISLRVGERHQAVLLQCAHEWRIRRIRTLLRLAFNRLARLAQSRIF